MNSLKKTDEDSLIDYRVSVDNLDRLGRMKDYMSAQVGVENSATKHFLRIQEKMKQALNSGEDFVRDDLFSKDEKSNKKLPKFSGKLWIVADYRCFSSCLLFLDHALHNIPNVTLVGSETNADTAYMEVAGIDVGGGLAEIMHPIKVNRAQVRKNNMPYTPEHTFKGNINDSKAVEAWVEKLIRDAREKLKLAP